MTGLLAASFKLLGSRPFRRQSIETLGIRLTETGRVMTDFQEIEFILTWSSELIRH